MNRSQLSAAMALLATTAPTNDTVMAIENKGPDLPQRIGRGTDISPKRQAKKATGLKGRQWVRFRKAQQRLKRGHELDSKGRIVSPPRRRVHGDSE